MGSSALWLCAGATAEDRTELEIDNRGFIVLAFSTRGRMTVSHKFTLLSTEQTLPNSLSFWGAVSIPSAISLGLQVNYPAAISPGFLFCLLSFSYTHIFVNSLVVNKPCSNYTVLRVPSVSCWDHDWISDIDLI